MTNTTFRKRALLSSVAMMLVALIALGSATFAWFSTTPTASASGVALQTNAQDGILVAADGLVQKNAAESTPISKADTFAGSTTLGWRSSTSGEPAVTTWALQTSFPLEAASYTQNCNSTTKTPVFLAFSSDNPLDPIGSSSATTNVTSGNASFSEKIFIKSISGDNAVYVSNVTINVTETTGSAVNQDVADAVRVLIVDDQGKVVAHCGTATAEANYYLETPSTNRDASLHKVETVDTKYALITPDGTKSDAYKLTNTVGASGDAYVMVYIYLDGEDSAVYNTNVSTSLETIIDSISITFTK